MYSTEPLQQAPQAGDIVKIIRRKTKSGEQITFMPSGRAPNLEYTKLPNVLVTYPADLKRQSAMQAAFNNSDITIIGERGESATNYDQADVPNKAQHTYYLGRLHPVFVPFVKAFIYQCWAALGASIQINSSYRDRQKQQELYDDWVNGTEQYQQDNAKPAKPGGVPSFHELGMAFDFNPTLSNGTGLTKTYNTLEEWEASGVPEIGRQVGMRWGGTFSGNYDPIHLDLGSKLSTGDRKQILQLAAEQQTSANRIVIPLNLLTKIAS
jgi:hypothetical protein